MSSETPLRDAWTGVVYPVRCSNRDVPGGALHLGEDHGVMRYRMKCAHGADGATLDNGWLRSPTCEHCNAQNELERMFNEPAYERRDDGYLSLMPEADNDS